MGEGELYSVKGGSSGINNARLNGIPLTWGTWVGAGDTLTIKLYMRNAAVGSGKNSGTVRLWYNDAQANSRFGAPEKYYLLNGFALGASAGAGPKKTIDVAAGRKGSPFKPFGELSITLP